MKQNKNLNKLVKLYQRTDSGYQILDIRYWNYIKQPKQDQFKVVNKSNKMNLRDYFKQKN